MSNQNFIDRQQTTYLSRPKNLWQRWMAWNGSFLILSILVHIILLGGATLLVVQVVQNRKEKMKFTAAPPSANTSVEHKVKPSKKTAAAAPQVTKRIISTSVNAQIALPAMELSATGPDVMASVMNGMGASGLGAGASGAAGMASMSLSGLTAFGFKGKMNGGLVGQFYDLKQTADGKPTDVSGSQRLENHLKTLEEYFSNGWDEKVLDRYFKAKNSLVACQIFMPSMHSEEATKAFGVDKEIKGLNWVVHYKGTVVAPRDGMFRFIGRADDMMFVRFNGQNVFADDWPDRLMDPFCKKLFPACYHCEPTVDLGLQKGSWFQVERGKSYPMEVIVSEDYGGWSGYMLMIEEQNPEKPYPKRSSYPKFLAYPVFQTRKGIPIPPYQNLELQRKLGQAGFGDPHLEMAPEVAPDPVIFPGN